ncbi:MAG: hypothetical protein KDA79_05065 [Planctomycetaceae bacterium]|nr:hypothetical protein [Planctomycetaceae bacterium]
MMRSSLFRNVWLLCAAVACLQLSVVVSPEARAAEPYPFETKPREVDKETVLKVDFEGSLPRGGEILGDGEVRAGIGVGGSKGLIATKKGEFAIFPIQKERIGQSRFDLTMNYGGEGFGYVVARLRAYDRSGKVLKTATAGAGWGITPSMNSMRRQETTIEVEEIYGIALVLEKTTDEGTVQVDNIELVLHDNDVIYGRSARKLLTSALTSEGLEVTELGDLWVAKSERRTSYFDASRIDENKRYVRSEWQERLHVGTTFHQINGELPGFMLGVSASQASLDLAATKLKKPLVGAYEYFLDDVKDHGFNLVKVDFTKELEEFDRLAAARGIRVILQDPSWNGLEEWVSKPNDPAPAAWLEKAKTSMAHYAKMKSLIGVHMNRPLGQGHQKMLAEARKHLKSLAPKVQLVAEEASVYTGEYMEAPYPNLGLQTAGYNHYAGQPWIRPSNIYHPNYWPLALTEGYFRQIFDDFRVHAVPTLINVPVGPEYRVKSISMLPAQVSPERTGWIHDSGNTWSGWYRYRYPQNLLRSIVWKAVESGAAGVIFDSWGPSSVPVDFNGAEAVASGSVPAGSYRPEELRLADMSESEAWKELGVAGRELAGYQQMLAETTVHGHNTATSNNSDVKVRTLTGRSDPFKVLAISNMAIGEYDEEELKIDPATGELQGYTPAGSVTCKITIEKDYGLIDMATGRTFEPISEDAERKAVYEITLGPGEGRLFFRGKLRLFRRFASKYGINPDRTAGVQR